MAIIELETNETTYISQLITDYDNQILITTTGWGANITGFVDADIVFGGTSTYNPESLSSSAAPAVGGASKFASDLVGSNVRTNNVKLSRQSWQSSSFNSLTFDLFIVSTSESSLNPITEGTKIYDYLLPKESNAGFMFVPNGYTVNPLGAQENAVDVTIGTWFQSVKECFLMTAGTMEVSKQKMSDGKTPLYVKINVTLSPSRDFYSDEVKSWFKI